MSSLNSYRLKAELQTFSEECFPSPNLGRASVKDQA
jgi:hypothetical protein